MTGLRYLLLYCLLVGVLPVYGQTADPTPVAENLAEPLVEITPDEVPPRRTVTTAVVRLEQSREQLQAIQSSMADKRSQLDELRRTLEQESDPVEMQETQQRIEQAELDLTNLRRSFENLALGGLDLSVFDDSQQSMQFDWQQELQTILKPLFQKLKELTERPRQMERLNSRLAQLDSQGRIAVRAIEHIRSLMDESLDAPTRERLQAMLDNWTRQLSDIERETDISRLQLNILVDGDETFIEKVRSSTSEFVTGTGRNLALSIAAFLATMLLMRGLYVLYGRINRRSGLRNTTGARVLVYGYKALTVILACTAALVVLYLAGDMLLLVLALIILVFVLLGMRNYLPQFLDEIRVLLNVGAIREHERVIYNGLPWLVRSLGVYTYLQNPALEGMLRLPLSEVLPLVSRPVRDDEPWFPSRTGDWIMLGDGSVGQILRQTPEVVQIKTRGSLRNFITTGFMAAEPQNLSSGFGVMISFGIDYRHQAVATTEVPGRLHAAVERALGESDYGKYVEKLLVEFQEAAASSLNYLVHVSMHGTAADSYFAIARLLQRVCVETCNTEGWVIPFNQLTVHMESAVSRPD